MNLKVYSTRNGLYQGFLRSLYDSGIILSEIKIETSDSHLSYPDRFPENVVDYNSSNIWTSCESRTYNQYISIELKNYFLDISAYALGFMGGNYPMSWDFSVSSNGKDWIVLHEPRKSHELENIRGKIFPVKRSFVRFFKWTNKGPNSGNTAFYIYKLDLYGSAVKCTDDDNCKNVPHIEIPTICYRERKNYFIFVIPSFIIGDLSL